jgi:uncharacterized membrane protein YjgN (DUF898 family)/tetratricopeptide (TPR) repeat protein
MQRYFRRLWLSLGLACQLSIVVASAQTDAWQQHIDQLARTDAWRAHIDEAARDEIGYEEALEHLDQALEIAEEFGSKDPRLSQTVKALGDLEYDYDDPDLVEPSYKWIWEARNGDNYAPEFDRTHQDLAEGFYERALDIREEHLEPNDLDLDLARSHEDLAEVYYRDAREDDAAEHFERARDIFQEVLGEDHNDVARIRTRIGWNQFYLEEFEEAEKSFQHAIALRLSASAEPENVAGYREELGRFYVRHDQPEKATEAFEQVLDTRAGIWGESDPKFLDKIEELASVHGLRDQHREQEALLQRVLRIQERAHGPDSIEVANSLSKLGDSWNSRGNYGIAEHFFRRSADIREAAEGESLDLANDLTRVSDMLRRQERNQEAIEPAQRAYAIRSAQLDATDNRIIESLSELAGLYWSAEDYDQAATHYNEIIAIQEAEDPISPELARTLISLGRVHMQAEKTAEAVDAFERAVAILETHEDFAFDLASALSQLATAFKEEGRVSDSVAARSRAQEIRSEQIQNTFSTGWKKFVETTFGSTTGWVVALFILLFVAVILGVAAGMTALGAFLTKKLLRQYEPPPGAPVEPETPEPPETGPPAPIIFPGESAPRTAHAGETGAVGAVWAVPASQGWPPAPEPALAVASPASEPLPIILPTEADRTPPAPEPPEPVPTRRFSFHGEGGSLFGIHIINMLLALLTLGLYYFWGKVKALKYVYGQAEFDGDRFAFHGTGKELFLGWLRVVPIILLLYFFPQILALVWESEVAQIVGLFVLIAGIFFVIIPIAQIGSWRYRLSRTSWRGIRFSFRGRTKKYLGLYLKGLLLTILSFGLYSPVMMVELLRYQYGNTYFGNTKLRFHAKAIEIFPAFILSWVLSLFTLGFHNFWYQAELARYFWSHTTFATSRMRCHVTGGGLLWLTLSNGLLVLCTLGLAFPWVQVRTAKYWLENLHLENDLDLAVVEQDAQQVSAAAEGMADFLDLPIGF